jgi:hypothetical protein
MSTWNGYSDGGMKTTVEIQSALLERAVAARIPWKRHRGRTFGTRSTRLAVIAVDANVLVCANRREHVEQGLAPPGH